MDTIVTKHDRRSLRKSSRLDDFGSPIIKHKAAFRIATSGKAKKFVDVDLADTPIEDLEAISPRSSRRATTAIMDHPDHTTEPSINIWQAAKVADVSALRYHLYHSKSARELVNQRDHEQDSTLLHILCSQNRQPFQALQVLLEYGADPTARNIYGVQALHSVCLNCPTPLESIRLLLKYGATPNAKDGDGWTPLHYTARFCPEPLQSIMLLVGAGANINATDASNKTPMFCLLANGDFHVIVQWMLASGADTTITGEFLDQRTGKTRLGTVLSQATKYTRLESTTIMLQTTVSKDAIKQALKVADSREVTLRNKDMDEKHSEAQKKALDRLLLIKSMLEERLNKDVATHRKRTSFFQFINSSFRKEKPATVAIQ
ncbi:unnamed protein product [Umbelopsis ramanniana]